MRIGVDLGGTKIEALALDDAGQECARLRIPTPQSDYQAIVAAVTDAVNCVEQAAHASQSAQGGPASVGVGIPGTISAATGLVKNANTQALNGHPLDQDLTTALGRPVRVANDADCFALSEASDGAATPDPDQRSGRAPHPHVVFGVIIGTGTGGGVVVDGQLLVGPDKIAGEWGHNPLPWPTPDEWPLPPCWCGRHGCLELFLSGPGLQADHARHAGSVLTAPEIAQAAKAGDPGAQSSLARYEDRLARGLATILNTINPDVIVLGGGVSNITRIYENVPRLWMQYVFSDVVTTRLVPAHHGDSSGVRGAAWLWPLKKSTADD